MKRDLLMRICSETRDCITEPWIANGNLYATDGRIAVRFPVEVDGCVISQRTGEVIEYSRTVGLGDPPREVDSVFPNLHREDFPLLRFPGEALPDLEYESCGECEWNWNQAEGWVCPECGGVGKVPAVNQYVEWVLPCGEVALFANRYLHLLRDLNPLWLQVNPQRLMVPENPVAEMLAYCALGTVVLMGVRRYDVFTGKKNKGAATMALTLAEVVS